MLSLVPPASAVNPRDETRMYAEKPAPIKNNTNPAVKGRYSRFSLVEGNGDRISIRKFFFSVALTNN